MCKKDLGLSAKQMEEMNGKEGPDWMDTVRKMR